LGYIKRTPVTEYRTQARGGKGAKGSAARDEDFIRHLYIATMHNTLLFFTEKGKCFWLKVYEIPEGSKISKGRAIQNMLNIEPDDKVVAYMKVLTLDDDDYINNHYITLVTKKGIIKKTSLQAYSRPRQNGINAITVRENDFLLAARITDGTKEIILANRSGKAIRFNESTVRAMGRTASGVKGFNLSDEDDVIGMIVINSENEDILVVSENGYGKRSKLEDYRVTNRGAKGVKTINITEKTGNLIAIKAVTDTDDLMIINKSGIIIRLSVAELRVMGRATQGVRLININDNDSIAAVAKIHLSDVEIENQEILRNSENQVNNFDENETNFDENENFFDENEQISDIETIENTDFEE
jgi:DNA gyrase subunit A